MKKIIILFIVIISGFVAKAQWTGQSGSTDLTSNIYRTGYVGVGTTSAPASLLHLNSTVDARKTLRITWNNDFAKYLNIWQGTGGAAIDPIGTGILYLGYDQSTNVVMGLAGGVNTGNVGIGTSSPDAKLAVKGTVHANEVKVDLNVPGPDYVFNEDYNLTSLDSIKTYIDQNKHLPEVPSAKEMEKDGIQLGEMNMLLLKKIEELTLHVIEQNKKLAAQNELILKQNERLTNLENAKQN